MWPLHKLVLPGAGTRDPGLYVRPLGNWRPSDQAGPPGLAPGEGLATDTYFGVFPWAEWRRLAAIPRVFLVLTGRGRCRITIKTLAADRADDRTLQELTLDASEPAPVPLELGSADAVYIELVAQTPVTLAALGLWTDAAPVRPVALGLIVTTYRRLAAVRDTMAKLTRFIAADPEPDYGPITLTVVDNGRELGPCPGATVLPNPNVGGAGGFARGLSHLASQSGATHALFMDDDAATEDECLLRTRRLLAYAQDPRTAVSAAMLRAETRFMVHEQGALFEWGPNHRVISRKNGLDLLRRADLHRMLAPEPFRYGGWWFFAFPIRGALHYPYPMFVRGDDWLFSYMNDFAIVTLPGIASWQDGFETKIGPTEQYLAVKAFLVFEILQRDPARPLRTAAFFARWTGRNVFGYCYDRATMNCEAIADVLRGPGFWAANTELGPRLASLRQSVRTEHATALPPTTAPPDLSHKERRWRLFLRLLTLNGHLLPVTLLRQPGTPPPSIPRVRAPEPRSVFGHARADYVDAASGFTAAKDVVRCLLLLARLAALLLRLVLVYPSLRRAYRRSAEQFCTQAWWDGVTARRDPR